MRETLDPEGKGKATPSADPVASNLPEENRNGTSGEPSYCGRQHEHASKGFRRGVDRGQNAELQDKDEACEGEGIEANEEERRPTEC